jgi:hypothetical protein
VSRKFIAALAVTALIAAGMSLAEPAAHAMPAMDHAAMHLAHHPHACCRKAAVAASLMAAAIPCGEGHDCCFQQAPAEMPTLPVGRARTRAHNAAVVMSPVAGIWVAAPAETDAFTPARTTSYARLSTVLRN